LSTPFVVIRLLSLFNLYHNWEYSVIHHIGKELFYVT